MVLGCLASLAGQATAAVIAPPPGREVRLIEEHVLVVFDPLTSSQTLVMQHTFEGTSTPFGLLIPTPKSARLRLGSNRLQKAVQTKLHPVGAVQRQLEIEWVSWFGNCALRQIGDGQNPEEEKSGHKGARADPSSLGSARERLHDWLLTNGLTIAPAQAVWLGELMARGWSINAVLITPRLGADAPPPRLKGPVLVLTHTAEEPMLAAASPPFAISDDGTAGPQLEVSVLTEWSVNVDAASAPAPFFSSALTARDVTRLGASSGGLPWNFRRDGTLTAFKLPRPGGDGILHFARSEPRTAIRPARKPVYRKYRIRLPVEIFLFAFMAAAWLWMRFGRRIDDRQRLSR